MAIDPPAQAPTPDRPVADSAPGAPGSASGPVLRLVLGGLPAPLEPTTKAFQWSRQPRSLLALAVALEHLVGDAPDGQEWCPSLEQWFGRYERAASILAELSNGDARLLRSLSGPLLEGDDDRRGPGEALLIAATISVEGGRH